MEPDHHRMPDPGCEAGLRTEHIEVEAVLRPEILATYPVNLGTSASKLIRNQGHVGFVEQIFRKFDRRLES